MNKKNVAWITTIIFILLAVICFVVYKGNDSEYIIEKGHIAAQNIREVSRGNLFPVVSSSAYDEIVQKRNMCIVGMVVGSLGAIVSLLLALSGESKKNIHMETSCNKNTDVQKVNSYERKSSTMSNDYMMNSERRLKDLEELLKKGYISEAEYQEKRKEIVEQI